jgi:hypothetical protein
MHVHVALCLQVDIHGKQKFNSEICLSDGSHGIAVAHVTCGHEYQPGSSVIFISTADQ